MLKMVDKARWWSFLTGGRPMQLMRWNLDGWRWRPFTDIVAHRQIYYWRDHYGKIWMAATQWGWFRVAVPIENYGKDYPDGR